MLRTVLVGALLLISVLSVTAQLSDSEILLSASPAIAIPIAESAQDFTFGGGGSLGAVVPLGVIPHVAITAAADYTIAPIVGNLGSLSILSAGLGIRYNYPVSDSVSIAAFVNGGYYYGLFNEPDGSGGSNPVVGGGIGASVRLWPRLGIDAEVSYAGFLGLTNNLVLRIGTHFAIPVRQQGSGMIRLDDDRLQTLLSDQPAQPGTVTVQNIQLEPVFPVLFTFYNDNPLGTVTVHNDGPEPAHDVRVSLYVNQYMDGEVTCGVIDELGGGEEMIVPLRALFNDAVLNVSEGTRVLARITVEYDQGETSHSESYTDTLRLYDRNAITWDDDRKVAAFVTAKDTHVRSFSRTVVGMVPQNDAVSDNLLRGLALLEALNAYGIGYVPDPTTPYSDFSTTIDTVDYLQFPAQTLDLRSGDCDDLSTLYAALLESIGIPSAFVTVPGHIFAAFSLDQSVAEASRYIHHSDELIDKDGAAWIPVEVTALNQGFLTAWQRGAEAYRRFSESGEAGFHSVHSAWVDYEPVAFDAELPIDAARLETAESAIVAATLSLAERESGPLINELLQRLEQDPSNVRILNRLGTTYARFARHAEAAETFTRILDEQQYLPALVNLGNIRLLEESFGEALDLYRRAFFIDPENPSLLINLVALHTRTGDFDAASAMFERLSAAAPEVAEECAYLAPGTSSGGRASDVTGTRIRWEEE